MSRYIDADALDIVYEDGDMTCVRNLDAMPTVDAVPVRCKDCKWFQSGIDIDGKPFTRCNGSVRTYGHTAPDWFCADGEKSLDRIYNEMNETD